MRERNAAPIHEPAPERCLRVPRFAPRQDAQCQMPSHCVAHSWQSIFAQDMQRAKAGRSVWYAQRARETVIGWGGFSGGGGGGGDGWRGGGGGWGDGRCMGREGRRRKEE